MTNANNNAAPSCPLPPDPSEIGRLYTALGKLRPVSQNGTDGRVYGGDAVLIHVADGKRADAGRSIAAVIDSEMRGRAVMGGQRTKEQAYGPNAFALCPGCYMIVGFNAMVELARQNGQSFRELGRTMAAAFAKLAECGDDAECIEEINVILDPQ